ncbi:MFS transporter [Luedemannella helvata]|uniref:MFS transporter n=1 Tax=Luedemannella helvata TaxID=349315 RepID=A0ABN2KAA3_9ACTN
MTAPTAEDQTSTRSERVGWYMYDWANSAFSTTVISVFLGPYLTSIAQTAANCPTNADGDVECGERVISALGIPIAPGSLFSYALSLSVILQVVVLPVVGAIADRSGRKKELLAMFAYIGAAATVGLLFLTGDRFLVGTLLFVLANIAFGASIVVYNSFLPQLAPPDKRDAVSSLGWAMGYVGGGLLLLLNLVAVIVLEDTYGKGEIARWSIVSAGLWWAAFTTIPLIRLRNRPPVAGPARGNPLTDGFKQLWHTLKELKTYPLSLFFLLVFLVYNDGIQTVIGVASIYADQYLKLDQAVQLQTILIVQFLAFGGALLLGRVARTYGAWKTVLGSLVLWTIVLGVAYFLPVGNAGAFMMLGALLGIVLGGSQALSRSLFSQLIPKGKEAEYFGIYEISDKGTSWLGPLLFGITYQATGEYKIAIISLIAFFVIGFVGLAAVPMRRAIVEAGNTPPKVL